MSAGLLMKSEVLATFGRSRVMIRSLMTFSNRATSACQGPER
jgi:hypothetical protein